MFPGKALTRILGGVGLLAATSLFGILLQGCGSDTDDRPATWSYVYPAIIAPSCATASCHSAFTDRSGVSFGDTDTAYYQMVCRHFVVTCPTAAMPFPCDTTIVTSDATCPTRAAADSQVIHQMNADGAQRMPPDFPLPAADIALISKWITNGAQND